MARNTDNPSDLDNSKIVASFDREDFDSVGRDLDMNQLAVALDGILSELGYAVVQGYNDRYAYYLVELPDE